MSEQDSYSTRIYTVPFVAFPISTTSGAAAFDLWAGTATTVGRMELKEVNIGQLSTNTAGNQQLNVQIYRGSTAIGGGSAVTPANLKGWATAPAAGAAINAPSSNLSSTSAATLVIADNTDWSGNWDYQPQDFEEITMDTGQAFFVRVSAPPVLTYLSGTLKFKEVTKLK
jgi:hypothetical protein